MTTLSDAAIDVLTTVSPWEKAEKTHNYFAALKNREITKVGLIKTTPDRPSRPANPELLHPRDMPKRRKAGSVAGKNALLHALAHIELNAIDLSWDIIARFAYIAEENGGHENGFKLPFAFFEDWAKVADDEAKHFLMLSKRMRDFDSEYGDLPAHDGLWESAERTAHDFAARLAIVPMVLEARGLDVTPHMAANMEKYGDHETAQLFKVIHDDEITHVRAGTVWFEKWCEHLNKTVDEYWQDLVREYFNGNLKRPFNDPSREEAGMLRHWYEPLADD